jgi:hypothetical protein
MLDDFRDFYNRMPLPVATDFADPLLGLVTDSDHLIVHD